MILPKGTKVKITDKKGMYFNIGRVESFNEGSENYTIKLRKRNSFVGAPKSDVFAFDWK